MLIQETCVEIDRLQEQSAWETRVRTARRKKIRHIDELLNEFEVLNLDEAGDIPGHLRGQVGRIIYEECHPLAERSVQELHVTELMDALFDVQERYMFPSDEESEE